MKPKPEPRITYSPLTKQWFVVTRYRRAVGVDAMTGEKTHYLRAREKHDITNQMTLILRKMAQLTMARTQKKAV